MGERRHPKSKRAFQNPSVSGLAESLHQNEESFLVETQQQVGKSWITDAIIIALVTGIAYLWTLSYELGFYGYFHIPYYLISLNPPIILTITWRTFSQLWFLALFILGLSLLGGYLGKNPTRIFIGLVLGAFLFLGSFVVRILSGSEYTWGDIVMAIDSAILLLFLFLRPLYVMRKEKGSYWNKLTAQIKITETTNPSRHSTNPRLYEFLTMFLIFTSVVLLTPTFHEMGRGDAKRQEDFFVVTPSKSPEIVVLRSYGEYFLAVPAFPATQEFEKKLVILKMSEMATPEKALSLKKVGSLHAMP